LIESTKRAEHKKYDNWYVENNKQLKWAKRKIDHGFTQINTDLEGGGRKAGTKGQRHRAAVLDFKYFLDIFLESIEFDS
jgi:hypothetical protein